MQMNAEDGGTRKFIMVQLPELTKEDSEARKAGYETICDIGEERIRRAGRKIQEETASHNVMADRMEKEKEEVEKTGKEYKKEIPEKRRIPDIGFRVFRVDSSNMEDVYYRPEEYKQSQINLFEENIKEGRTAEDLLFQSMLDLGVLPSSKIEEKSIAGRKVFSVEDGYLMACFDENVTDDVVKAIAKVHPVYAVFRDRSMADDSVAANFEQIFRTYSPSTVRKVL